MRFLRERRYGLWLIFSFLTCREPHQEITDGIQWFLGGWYTDNSEKSEKDSTPVMDWDMDQWRIYSAFRKQYGIDLNTMKMHFWVFMGLLTTLDECAFTRVADIRGKIVTGKMSADEKEFYRKAKRRYAIGCAGGRRPTKIGWQQRNF